MAQTLTDFYKNYANKRQRSKKLPKFLFAAVIVVVIICLIISLIVTKSPKSEYAAKTFYFVHAGEYSSSSKATEVSSKVANLGGAGVIYTVGNTLFVVAGAYNSSEDANKVKEQIKPTFENAGVLKVESKKFSKSLSKTIHDVSACKNYYKSLYTFCEDLRAWGASYDLGELDISKIYKNVMHYKQNFASTSEGLKSLDKDYSKTMYASSLVVSEHIKSFFASAFVASNPSKYIKKLQICMIIEFIDMTNLI